MNTNSCHTATANSVLFLFSNFQIIKFSEIAKCFCCDSKCNTCNIYVVRVYTHCFHLQILMYFSHILHHEWFNWAEGKRERRMEGKYSFAPMSPSMCVCEYSKGNFLLTNIIHRNMTACGSTNSLAIELKIKTHMIWFDKTACQQQSAFAAYIMSRME